MPLNWQSLKIEAGNSSAEVRATVISELDQFGDRVRALLAAKGLRDSDSPLFGLWSLFVFIQRDRVVIAFLQPSGTFLVSIMDWRE